MKTNLSRTIFLILALLLFLAGCKSGTAEPPATPRTPAEDEVKTLKIAYPRVDVFMKEYGNTYKKAFPNVSIQVIPTMQQMANGSYIPIENSVILEQKPDLVYGSNLVTEMGGPGKLLDLALLMKQDSMNPSQFSPSALEAIRSYGNGSLVALSPSFQTVGLYYNKEIFDRLKIPYPTNGMSWRSVLQLAEKIARKEGDKQLYGLEYHSSASLLISRYLSGTGAEIYSSDNRKAQLTSKAYMTSMNEIIDAIRNGVVYILPENPPSTNNLKDSTQLRNKFITGEAAMRIDNPGLIPQQKLVASNIKEYPAFPIGLVSEPINPQKPGESYNVLVSDLFGIVAGSPNVKTAWEFLKFVTGPEMAAELEKTKPHVLSIRTDAAKTRDGISLEPFYSMRPFIGTPALFSQETGMQISSIFTKEMNDIIYGRRQVANGLQAMQDQVQSLLDQDFAGKK